MIPKFFFTITDASPLQKGTILSLSKLEFSLPKRALWHVLAEISHDPWEEVKNVTFRTDGQNFIREAHEL